MRNTLFLMGSAALVVLLGVGCTGPEHKLGRGLSNAGEVVRGEEMQRSIEQNGLFEGTDVGITTGVVQGVTPDAGANRARHLRGDYLPVPAVSSDLDQLPCPQAGISG